ncbi:MAG: YraN family protein [Phycisphaerae bacterium]|nr:YraN family protein [Phycisphaerae bacterium]
MWPFGRSKPLGRRGEQLARRHLVRSGLKILARNYRCPCGEIDVIALDRRPAQGLQGPAIVFVEVKTRCDDAWTDPSSAIDSDKRRRLHKAAAYYLSRRDCTAYNVRFDVVSVVLRPGQPPQVEHIANAFG